MTREKCALTSPDIAEYLIDSAAGVPAEEFLELIRFVRTLGVHIAQRFDRDSHGQMTYSINKKYFALNNRSKSGDTKFSFDWTEAGLTMFVFLIYKVFRCSKSPRKTRKRFIHRPTACVCLYECQWKPLKCRAMWKKNHVVKINKQSFPFSLPYGSIRRLSKRAIRTKTPSLALCVSTEKKVENVYGVERKTHDVIVGERWSVTVGEIRIFLSSFSSARRRRVRKEIRHEKIKSI